MKVSWDDRIKTQSNPEEIQKYYDAYSGYPCSDAVIDFITRFCITVDPRKLKDRELPFELFKKQEEYIHWLWDRYVNREDGVVDKCRGIGMSWMNAAFAVFLLLFEDAVTISMYTYKADECHEKDNIDTLMEKCIFIINNLPDLFSSGVTDKLMQIKNHNNDSIIVGKSGDSPGRGGRSSIYFLDECAFYPRADSIEAAVSRNADCKIWGSTHNGTNTLFYRKSTSGINPVITFDWWELPEMYDQEWYDREKEKAVAEGTLHIFKQEVERDASASLEACLIPSDWVNSAKRCTANLDGRIIASLDPSNEGGDVHGFVVVNGNMPIYAEESGEGDPADATDIFFWKAVDMGAEEFRYDSCGIGVGISIRLKQIIAELKNDPLSERSIAGLKVKIKPWDAGGEVLRKDQKDYADKTNGDFFENAKAQMYWKARTEFLNTYRMVNGKDHEADQLISFPEVITRALAKLIMELSQPQYKPSKRGKTMIDKKPNGSKSPNLADAYIICRAEIDEAWISWSVV